MDDKDARVAALEAELAERTRERERDQEIYKSISDNYFQSVMSPEAYEALEAELAAADDRCSRLAAAMAVVQEQAEDDGLWFRAEHVTEDYLQCALRRLHRVIEGEG